MGLLVQKFGGTSVGTPERIRAVADRIARTHAQGHGLVVVVSAMGHTTDELIELAHKVSEAPNAREMDMLLTAGERVSMALLSMALADRGIPAISFTGSQSGIITDESHRRARIRRILGDRIRKALGDGKVAIVAGFQGVSETKEITTLGRGGSDTTAAALAAVLKADACEIFTDVDGVFSADPRVVPGAVLRKRIPHDLMVELATRGAGVLHPRSVELAKQFGVRLRVRNSLSPVRGEGEENEGTVLGGGMENFDVVGVTCDKGRMLATVELQRATVIGALWELARQNHLSFTSPIFSGGKVQFFVERDSETEWRRILDRLTVDGFLKQYELDRDRGPVSAVGNRFSQDGAALQEMTEALARDEILVTMGAASALAATFAVQLARMDDAVRVLHEALIEKKVVQQSS